MTVSPHMERWRKRDTFKAVLSGANAVVAGAISGVGLTLLPPAVPDVWAAGLFMMALALLVRWKVIVVWTVVGGVGSGMIHVLGAA